MTDPRCRRRTLAAGDLMLVEQCSCGAVHLTIGAVTLRLARSSIGSLASTLEAAARALAVPIPPVVSSELLS